MTVFLPYTRTYADSSSGRLRRDPGLGVVCKRDYTQDFHALKGDDEIQLSDTVIDLFAKLSEGNMGGARVAIDFVATYAQVNGNHDRYGDLMGVVGVLGFDTFGITGPHIWMLYKDVCAERIVCVHTVMRAMSLELINPNEVYCAIENYGYGLDPQKLLSSVRQMDPEFAPMGLVEDDVLQKGTRAASPRPLAR
jgi:hypothetical protein